MRTITRADIERIIGEKVQPLFSGIVQSTSGMLASLTNLIPFGTSPTNYRLAFPFGLVSAPIQGIMAYILNLGGSALAPIILTHLDKMRPTPSAPGETLLYALAPDGSKVAVWLRLRNDGTFELNNGTQEWVTSQVALMQFLVNARTNTLEGPQPLFDITGTTTPQALLEQFESFQEGG